MTYLRRFIDNHWVIIILRLLLAVLFLFSATGKLMSLEGSVHAVYNFQLMPDWAIIPLGYTLPFIELACGLGLLFGVLTRLSAMGIGAMSLVFFVAKAIVLFVQHRPILCGCFGELMDTFASVTIYMDLPVLLLALGIIFSNSRDWLAIGKLLPEEWKRKLRIVW